MNAAAENPRWLAEQYANAIAQEFVLSPEAHAMREEALAMLPSLLLDLHRKRELADFPIMNLLAGYMLCTYAWTERKHEIKRAINRIVRDSLTENGVEDWEGKPAAPSAEKPTCLIITNHFKVTHVMFRTFAKSLHALRDRFRTVNLCLHETDEAAAKIFDETKVFQYRGEHYIPVMKHLRDLVKSYAPEVILYADIAMHPFGAMLSTLRLAPLQLVISGHPAPSQSPAIDAFLIGDAFKGKTPDFDEPVVHYREEDFAIYGGRIMQPGPNRPDPITRTRIVVPATTIKLTPPYLETLARIEALSGAQIDILADCVPGQETLLQAHIARSCPGARLYRKRGEDYAAHIAASNLFLCTFPFSGNNSVNDCLALGIPGVVMRGRDIASHQGAVMIERTGSLSLLADNTEHFIAQAVTLARSPMLRRALQTQLLETFAEPQKLSVFAPSSPAIANAAWALHQNRSLRTSDARPSRRAENKTASLHAS